MEQINRNTQKQKTQFKSRNQVRRKSGKENSCAYNKKRPTNILKNTNGYPIKRTDDSQKQEFINKADSVLSQNKKSIIEGLQSPKDLITILMSLDHQQFDEKYHNNPFFRQKINFIADECQKICQKENTQKAIDQRHVNEPQYYFTLKAKRQQRKQQILQLFNQQKVPIRNQKK